MHTFDVYHDPLTNGTNFDAEMQELIVQTLRAEVSCIRVAVAFGRQLPANTPGEEVREIGWEWLQTDARADYRSNPD